MEVRASLVSVHFQLWYIGLLPTRTNPILHDRNVILPWFEKSVASECDPSRKHLNVFCCPHCWATNSNLSLSFIFGPNESQWQLTLWIVVCSVYQPQMFAYMVNSQLSLHISGLCLPLSFVSPPLLCWPCVASLLSEMVSLSHNVSLGMF